MIFDKKLFTCFVWLHLVMNDSRLVLTILADYILSCFRKMGFTTAVSVWNDIFHPSRKDLFIMTKQLFQMPREYPMIALFIRISLLSDVIMSSVSALVVSYSINFSCSGFSGIPGVISRATFILILTIFWSTEHENRYQKMCMKSIGKIVLGGNR